MSFYCERNHVPDRVPEEPVSPETWTSWDSCATSCDDHPSIFVAERYFSPFLRLLLASWELYAPLPHFRNQTQQPLS